MDTTTLQTVLPPSTPADLWAMVGAMGTTIAALTTIAIAVIAYRGLRSLTLAQQDMVNRATREARDCAIDRCREMADVIIPLNSPILQQFVEKAVPVFVEDPASVTFGTAAETEARNDAAHWVAQFDAELYASCVEVLNKSEAWAMYFTNALAEETVAYGPCAPVFMALVIQLYPLLVHLRSRDQSGNFPNVVMLFETWYGKTVDAQNAEQAEKLLALVQNLQTKGGAYKRLPDPIGTQP